MISPAEGSQNLEGRAEAVAAALARSGAYAVTDPDLLEAAQGSEAWMRVSDTFTRKLVAGTADEPLQLIAAAAVEVADADFAVIALLDETDPAVMCIRASVGPGAGVLPRVGTEFPASLTLMGAVIASGDAVMVDASTLPSLPTMPKVAEIGPVAVVPFAGIGGAVGALSVGRLVGRPVFTERDLIKVIAFATNSALAVEVGAANASRAHEEALASQARIELLEQLATTEARERRILAEAVHDDPLQLVIAALLRLDDLRIDLGVEAGGELDRIANILETSIARLRTLISALTPPDLSEGIGVALRDLAQGVFIATNTKIHMVGPAHLPLAVSTKLIAHQILREALVNARRHAQADNVTIRLNIEGARVILSVEDDGVGSNDILPKPGHLGITTMTARTNSEAAELQITSEPGHGTTVAVTFATAAEATPQGNK